MSKGDLNIIPRQFATLERGECCCTGSRRILIGRWVASALLLQGLREQRTPAAYGGRAWKFVELFIVGSAIFDHDGPIWIRARPDAPGFFDVAVLRSDPAETMPRYLRAFEIRLLPLGVDALSCIARDEVGRLADAGRFLLYEAGDLPGAIVIFSAPPTKKVPRMSPPIWPWPYYSAGGRDSADFAKYSPREHRRLSFPAQSAIDPRWG